MAKIIGGLWLSMTIVFSNPTVSDHAPLVSIGLPHTAHASRLPDSTSIA